MGKNPAFIKHVAKGVKLLKNGEYEEAREEFATNRLTCEKMAKASGNEEYWQEMARAMQQMVDWIDRKQRGEAGGGLSKEKKRKLAEDLKGIQPKTQSSGIQYSDGVGQEEKEATEDSTEEVVQDRIDFLEDEIRKSEETVMELKQELDQLKEEKN
jgi:hypothetical protein